MANGVAGVGADPTGGGGPSMARVVAASAAGTAFEWYDFFVFVPLATIIAKQFSAGLSDSAAFLFALGSFAVGFAFRPVGALVFGRIGDRKGRKGAFLVTVSLMGGATFCIGLLPSYAQLTAISPSLGLVSPLLFVGLRMAQGIALGGEYGGAATYIAEHAPAHKRGENTSWIQTTATAGLFVSLIVILLCRALMSDAAFKDWGWRVPFLLSAVLLGVSVWIRMQLEESPVFKAMKAEGRGSKNPFAEAFGRWSNAKVVLLAIVGVTMGQGVVFYASQFQALFFLQNALHLDYTSAYVVVMVALALATPFFVLFGRWSDRIGRKWIILAGCALAAVLYLPLFHGLASAVNPGLVAAQKAAPAVVRASDCETNFFAKAFNNKPTRVCDKMSNALYTAGVNYTRAPADPASPFVLELGTASTLRYDAAAKTYTVSTPGAPPALFAMTGPDKAKAAKAGDSALSAALKGAGYPAKADPARVNWVATVAILWLLVMLVCMVYGPIAAYLVELFPTRIRYTSMSLPYHIGNGWFGGFLPFFMLAIAAFQGNIFAGLIYPIAVAGVGAVVGALFLPETKDRLLDD